MFQLHEKPEFWSVGWLSFRSICGSLREFPARQITGECFVTSCKYPVFLCVWDRYSLHHIHQENCLDPLSFEIEKDQDMYAIIFTIIFLTGVFAAENKRALEPYSDDWAASTTYLIRHCNYGEADSEASYLQGLLRQINLHLENVIADAQLGTGSSKGYSAFFKSNENVHEVMRVYKQMAAGEDIMVPSILNASILETKPARPTFVCVADTSDHGGMYRQCVNEGSHIPILALPETETVALCPLFWQEDRVPLPRTDCPRISGNTVSPNIRGLYHNQEAMIVFKLAELYGKVDKASNVAMKIQDAVDLDAKHSVESPYNFALYYAGQYSRLYIYVDDRFWESFRHEYNRASILLTVARNTVC